MGDLNFLVVITGYNWERYVRPAVVSVLSQSYKSVNISIVDDGSYDDSANKIYGFCQELSDQLFFENNDIAVSVKVLAKNYGTINARNAAIDFGLEKFPKTDVIVLLDGDDELLPNALELVNKHYKENPSHLMTYGNYIYNNGEVCPVRLHYSDLIRKNRDYRKDTFRCTHLRTFKVELYKQVPQIIPTKSEIESYPDAELLFSMMEMCGQDRIGVIETPIYKYNTENPLNTLKRFGKDNAGYAEIINRPKRNLI